MSDYAAPGAAATATASPKPNTLLIAEADPAVRRMLASFCTRGGWRVLEAASAGEALRLAAAEALDVALVDAQLTAGEEHALIFGLREKRPVLRVAILTAGTGADFDAADAVFPKPLPLRKLESWLAGG